MISKQLDQITIEDLEKLVENSVSEKKTLEYKSVPLYGSDSERKEFLADISSFANASGGDLIFGVEQSDGIPVKVSGMKISNVDAEILKLENIIRDGIEPRINVLTHSVSLKDGNIVLIFRINRSWVGPHRVIFKGHDKFYSRNSAGKYPLDTNELKIAFTLSQTLVDKIGDFKNGRILDLLADKTPIPFYNGGKIVLHLIPLESFNLESSFGLNKLQEVYPKMVPMRASGWNQKINLEGLLSYSGGQNDKSHSYVQLYRSGIIEAVEGLTLSSNQEQKVLPSTGYEGMLIKALNQYMGILKDLKINPPVVVFLTLLGVNGYRITSSDLFFDSDENNLINKDVLNLPETLVENYDTSSTSILRPMFDLVWNACGFEKSLNFDENGEWIVK